MSPDEALKTQAQNLITDIDTQYNVKVATSLVELNGERVTVDGVYGNRTGETNLGDLITDAMKWYIMKDGTDLGVPASNVVTIEGGGGTATYKVYMDALNNASAVLKSADSTTEDYLKADAELLTAMKALKKKNAQPMKASGKTVKLRAKLLKKKTLTVTAKKAFAVSKNKGPVTYKKSSGNKKITVSPKGKITVKKGLRKGTYKVKVKVTAAGNDNYRKGSKNVTVTIKVN